MGAIMKKHPEVFREKTQTASSLRAENAPSESTIQTIAEVKPRAASTSGSGVDGAADSTLPSAQILAGLKALKRGDFDTRLAGAWTGVSGQVADTFNELAELLSNSTNELTRISRVAGREGEIQERVPFGQATGGWAEQVNSVNALIDGLAHPISETARVLDAVAKGDLSRNMALEMDGRRLEGEFLRTAETVNRMVSQLRVFAAEVNRVAHEVGMEGKLGGQASVRGAAGTWKELTENVNQLAANLTMQVRAIAEVATAVARGELTRFIE